MRRNEASNDVINFFRVVTLVQRLGTFLVKYVVLMDKWSALYMVAGTKAFTVDRAASHTAFGGQVRV